MDFRARIFKTREGGHVLYIFHEDSSVGYCTLRVDYDEDLEEGPAIVCMISSRKDNGPVEAWEISKPEDLDRFFSGTLKFLESHRPESDSVRRLDDVLEQVARATHIVASGRAGLPGIKLKRLPGVSYYWCSEDGQAFFRELDGAISKGTFIDGKFTPALTLSPEEVIEIYRAPRSNAVADAFASAAELIAAGQKRRALDTLFRAADAALTAGRFDEVNDCLASADVESADVDLCVTLLMSTKAARGRLPSRAAAVDTFARRVQADLPTRAPRILPFL